MRIYGRQIKKAAYRPSASPILLRNSIFILYLAGPPTWLDTHADPGSYIVCDGIGIFSAYACAVQSLLGQINNNFAVLLVVIVPQIVPMKYISTTLGAHKSVGVIQFNCFSNL